MITHSGYGIYGEQDRYRVKFVTHEDTASAACCTVTLSTFVSQLHSALLGTRRPIRVTTIRANPLLQLWSISP